MPEADLPVMLPPVDYFVHYDGHPCLLTTAVAPCLRFFFFGLAVANACLPLSLCATGLRVAKYKDY